MKILIAESLDGFRESLRNELKNRHTVSCCKDGKRVLELIKQTQPDILVLDLALSGFDGLSILRALSHTTYKPKVLATTYHVSEYIVKELEGLSVDYIILKPSTVCAAMSHINAMITECEHSEDADEFLKLDRFLQDLGFDRSKSGYDCVRYALYCVHYQGLTMMTKEIYPAVAKACGGTVERVEKAIRDAIRDAWKCRHSTFWQLHFPMKQSGKKSYPSNARFLWSYPSEHSRSENIVNIL